MRKLSFAALIAWVALVSATAQADEFVAKCKAANGGGDDAQKMCACIAGKASKDVLATVVEVDDLQKLDSLTAEQKKAVETYVEISVSCI